MGWPRGEAADCKSVYRGSNPLPTSTWGSGRVDMRSVQSSSVCGSLRIMDRGAIAGLTVGGAVVLLTVVLASIIVVRG